jgi:RNA polymerase sigma factor (sigma-70 family)
MYDDSTQWILDQIGNHPLLTREQEQEAAKDRIEAFEALRDGMMAHPYSWDFFIQKREEFLANNHNLGRLCEGYGSNSFNMKEAHERVDAALQELFITASQKKTEQIQQLFRDLDIAHDLFLELWFTIRSLPYQVTNIAFWQKAKLEKEYDKYIKARNILVNYNYKLVIKSAKNFWRKEIPFEDLIQEGNIGLVRAAAKFQPDVGRFTTYATWWIHQSISRYLEGKNLALRAPQYVQRVAGKIRRINEHLTKQYGREPTEEEMAEFADIPADIFHELFQVTTRPLSMERIFIRIDPGETEPLKNVIVSEKDVSEEVEISLQCAKIVEAMKGLKARERLILERRFGLGGQPPESLEHIALDLGYSRERIRQIEGHALDKIRDWLPKEDENERL